MRMTFKQLRMKAALMYRDSVIINHESSDGLELRISYEEFCDLKKDIEFVNQFHWGSMQVVPTEFMCNGVKCIVEIKK